MHIFGYSLLLKSGVSSFLLYYVVESVLFGIIGPIDLVCEDTGECGVPRNFPVRFHSAALQIVLLANVPVDVSILLSQTRSNRISLAESLAVFLQVSSPLWLG